MSLRIRRDVFRVLVAVLAIDVGFQEKHHLRRRELGQPARTRRLDLARRITPLAGRRERAQVRKALTKPGLDPIDDRTWCVDCDRAFARPITDRAFFVFGDGEPIAEFMRGQQFLA